MASPSISDPAIEIQALLRELDAGTIKTDRHLRMGLRLFHRWGDARPAEAIHFLDAAGEACLALGEAASDMLAIAAGLAYLGAARACGWPPFFKFGSDWSETHDDEGHFEDQLFSTFETDAPALAANLGRFGRPSPGAHALLLHFASIVEQDWILETDGFKQAHGIEKHAKAFADDELPERIQNFPARYELVHDDASSLALEEAMRVWSAKAELEAAVPAGDAAAPAPRL